MTIQLSRRLSAIAARVPRGARVVDVGTDHARLPVWLVQTGRATHVFASDVRRGPLQGAGRLLRETGTEGAVTLRLTDGLAGFGPGDADTVVIAGMGGETMARIIGEAPWLREGVLLILSPHTKAHVLRSALCDLGFRIESEALTAEDGRLYPVLTARGGQAEPHREPELYTGRFSLIDRDPLFPVLMEHLMKSAKRAAPYDPEAAERLAGFGKMKERYDAMPTVGEIFSELDRRAPVSAKLDFDNVGLLVGHEDRKAARVLAALDITDRVIDEAIRLGADVIVSHHPLFFELKSVTDGTWTGSRVLRLAENGIAAICMHTNLDAAPGGVNDALLAALGLRYAGELDPDTMIGRVGLTDADMTMPDFLARVKTALNANGLRCHDAGRPVRRVAVCGGSGGSELALAHAAGCDTYVTADIKYDPFLEAAHLGMNLIDADHFCTENVVVPVLRDWLREAFPGLEVLISRDHCQTARFF